MANRSTYPLQHLRGGTAIIAGSFGTNGSSAPTEATTRGLGYTVTRASAGTYTVTFTDKWTAAESITVGANCATRGAFSVEAGPYDSAASTLTLYTLVSGTATDVASDAASRVNFCIVFRNSAAGSR